MQPPPHRLEYNLHPWVGFFAMPVSALAIAGVAMSGSATPGVASPVTLGVILGLLLGKPVGILVAVRMRVAELPQGVNWQGIHAAGWLGGIGFTMSLFIGRLAFRNPVLLADAKIGILVASTLAGTTGYMLLKRSLKRRSGAVS